MTIGRYQKIEGSDINIIGFLDEVESAIDSRDDEIESLKKELKESQDTIEKLEQEIIDLENQ